MKVIFLGTDDFPFGMAEVEKQTLVAKALMEVGCDIKFICKKSSYYNSLVPYKGQFSGIKYFYTNFSSKRLSNRYINRLSWILGSFVEKLFLLFDNYDFAIVNSRNYEEIKWYSKLIHLRGRKLLLMYPEDARSMYSGNNPKRLRQLDNFEKKTWKMVDGAFPISEELFNQIRIFNPSLPQLKIPVLVDLDCVKSSAYPNPIDTDYFMYCGSADYSDTIDFIIDGFIASHCTAKLLLVISGSKRGVETVHQKIKLSGMKDSIIVSSYLSKEILWGYYCNALALLIPLNFNQRDKARFPHKIGEYCAAGRSIITSNWGEIPYYFIDNENSILLKSNDPKELGKALNMIKNNPILRDKLGKGALKLAEHQFNYKLFGKKIITFVSQK